VPTSSAALQHLQNGHSSIAQHFHRSDDASECLSVAQMIRGPLVRLRHAGCRVIYYASRDTDAFVCCECSKALAYALGDGIYRGALSTRGGILGTISLRHFDETYTVRELAGMGLVLVGTAISWT
jgi:hypothetical protein